MKKQKICFGDRWASMALEERRDYKTKMLLMQRRIGRYSKIFQHTYKFVSFLFEYLSPLFTLGKFSRAGTLSQIDFLHLLEALQKSRSHWVRMTTIFVLHPYFDVLIEEDVKPRKPHPLQDYLKNHEVDSNHYDFDLVIIGSGAGGSPLAYELSNKNLRVAILEKGYLAIPEEATQVVEKHFVQQGLLGAIRHSITMVIAGSCVGGTTAVNSGTCPQPLQECLQEWDEIAGTQFAQGELQPYLNRITEYLHVAPSKRELLSVSSTLFESGMQAIGRPETYILPRNAPGCEGVGRCFVVCPTQAKQSTDISFLPQAIRNGATLFEGMEVKTIKETNTGVRLEAIYHKNPNNLEGPKRKIIFTAKHVVIAAGAIFTPKLIRKNRLGKCWKKAGKNLKIHPAAKVYAYFPNISNVEAGVLQAVGYKAPELPRAGFEGVHMPHPLLPHTLGIIGPQSFWWLRHHDHLASFGVFVRDRGQGQVKHRGNLIDLDYTLDPQDALDLGESFKIMAKAFFAAGAQKILMPLLYPQEIASPEALDNLSAADFKPQNMIISGFHPQGTAGISRVVHNDLTIIGCHNISVCDASVFPDSPGVNPMITIMALSLRLADYLLSKLGNNDRN